MAVDERFDQTPNAQDEVANLYSKLWRKLGDFRTSEVRAQFLSNVGLPPAWFKGKLCLDVGCGSGFAVWCIENLGGRCYACDIKSSGLLNIRDSVFQNNCRAKFISASALQLPFPSEIFDFVHCNGVLHHTLSPREGFREICRVTRPGGKVFVSLYGKGGLYGVGVALARLFAHIVPYKLTDRLLEITVGNTRIPNSFVPAKVSLLDNMYVPIRRSYREHEIRQWFSEEGFSNSHVKRRKNIIYDHETKLNKLIHGEGYLNFISTKPTIFTELPN